MSNQTFNYNFKDGQHPYDLELVDFKRIMVMFIPANKLKSDATNWCDFEKEVPTKGVIPSNRFVSEMRIVLDVMNKLFRMRKIGFDNKETFTFQHSFNTNEGLIKMPCEKTIFVVEVVPSMTTHQLIGFKVWIIVMDKDYDADKAMKLLRETNKKRLSDSKKKIASRSKEEEDQDGEIMKIWKRFVEPVAWEEVCEYNSNNILEVYIDAYLRIKHPNLYKDKDDDYTDNEELEKSADGDISMEEKVEAKKLETLRSSMKKIGMLKEEIDEYIEGMYKFARGARNSSPSRRRSRSSGVSNNNNEENPDSILDSYSRYAFENDNDSDSQCGEDQLSQGSSSSSTGPVSLTDIKKAKLEKILKKITKISSQISRDNSDILNDTETKLQDSDDFNPYTVFSPERLNKALAFYDDIHPFQKDHNMYFREDPITGKHFRLPIAEYGWRYIYHKRKNMEKKMLPWIKMFSWKNEREAIKKVWGWIKDSRRIAAPEQADRGNNNEMEAGGDEAMEDDEPRRGSIDRSQFVDQDSQDDDEEMKEAEKKGSGSDSYDPTVSANKKKESRNKRKKRLRTKQKKKGKRARRSAAASASPSGSSGSDDDSDDFVDIGDTIKDKELKSALFGTSSHAKYSSLSQKNSNDHETIVGGSFAEAFVKEKIAREKKKGLVSDAKNILITAPRPYGMNLSEILERLFTSNKADTYDKYVVGLWENAGNAKKSLFNILNSRNTENIPSTTSNLMKFSRSKDHERGKSTCMPCVDNMATLMSNTWITLYHLFENAFNFDGSADVIKEAVVRITANSQSFDFPPCHAIKISQTSTGKSFSGEIVNDIFPEGTYESTSKITEASMTSQSDYFNKTKLIDETSQALFDKRLDPTTGKTIMGLKALFKELLTKYKLSAETAIMHLNQRKGKKDNVEYYMSLIMCTDWPAYLFSEESINRFVLINHSPKMRIAATTHSQFMKRLTKNMNSIPEDKKQEKKLYECMFKSIDFEASLIYKGIAFYALPNITTIVGYNLYSKFILELFGTLGYNPTNSAIRRKKICVSLCCAICIMRICITLFHSFVSYNYLGGVSMKDAKKYKAIPKDQSVHKKWKHIAAMLCVSEDDFLHAMSMMIESDVLDERETKVIEYFKDMFGIKENVSEKTKVSVRVDDENKAYKSKSILRAVYKGSRKNFYADISNSTSKFLSPMDVEAIINKMESDSVLVKLEEEFVGVVGENKSQPETKKSDGDDQRQDYDSDNNDHNHEENGDGDDEERCISDINQMFDSADENEEDGAEQRKNLNLDFLEGIMDDGDCEMEQNGVKVNRINEMSDSEGEKEATRKSKKASNGKSKKNKKKEEAPKSTTTAAASTSASNNNNNNDTNNNNNNSAPLSKKQKANQGILKLLQEKNVADAASLKEKNKRAYDVHSGKEKHTGECRVPRCKITEEFEYIKPSKPLEKGQKTLPNAKGNHHQHSNNASNDPSKAGDRERYLVIEIPMVVLKTKDDIMVHLVKRIMCYDKAVPRKIALIQTVKGVDYLKTMVIDRNPEKKLVFDEKESEMYDEVLLSPLKMTKSQKLCSLSDDTERASADDDDSDDDPLEDGDLEDDTYVQINQNAVSKPDPDINFGLAVHNYHMEMAGIPEKHWKRYYEHEIYKEYMKNAREAYSGFEADPETGRKKKVYYKSQNYPADNIDKYLEAIKKIKKAAPTKKDSETRTKVRTYVTGLRKQQEALKHYYSKEKYQYPDLKRTYKRNNDQVKENKRQQRELESEGEDSNDDEEGIDGDRDEEPQQKKRSTASSSKRPQKRPLAAASPKKTPQRKKKTTKKPSE